MANILVIEDEDILARNICRSLELEGHEATNCRTGEEGLQATQKQCPDLILLDYRLPGMDGLAVLDQLAASGGGASVVMMTAHGNIDIAVQAMRSGAEDFLTKPLDLRELQLIVDRVLEHRRLSGQLNYFRDRERAESSFDQIIGQSAPIAELKRVIDRLVSTPALTSKEPPSILLTGETGTGKDLVARAIHYAGPRRDAPFVHVNCTALPDQLIESELFGHVRGAFTDARSDKRGLLEFADGGTVFLDEIGHMPHNLQAKLLQTLEHRTIRPVGGTKDRKINVHFLSATNRVLSEAIEQGDFREDLFHRLRTLTIHLAPLRERGDDALLLAGHFCGVFTAKFGLPPTGFAPEAAVLLRDYDWPGNVRELAHTVESAVLMADGPLIHARHLNITPPTSKGQSLELSLPGGQTLAIDFSDDSPKLDTIEYQIIQAALRHCRHNASRAARILGVSRDAIRYRIEKFEGKKPGENQND